VITITFNDNIKYSLAEDFGCFPRGNPWVFQGINHISFHVELFDKLEISPIRMIHVPGLLCRGGLLYLGVLQRRLVVAKLDVRFPEAPIQLALVVRAYPMMSRVEVPLGCGNLHALMDRGIEILCFYHLFVGLSFFNLF
jgi:hypothetical protein